MIISPNQYRSESKAKDEKKKKKKADYAAAVTEIPDS